MNAQVKKHQAEKITHAKLDKFDFASVDEKGRDKGEWNEIYIIYYIKYLYFSSLYLKVQEETIVC